MRESRSAPMPTDLVFCEHSNFVFFVRVYVNVFMQPTVPMLLYLRIANDAVQKIIL